MSESSKEYFNIKRQNPDLPWLLRVNSWGDPRYISVGIVVGMIVLCLFGLYYNTVLH
jgi:hypothetical protein